MKENIVKFKRPIALLLVLVCLFGLLPLSATAAGEAPATISQISSSYVTINGHYARYRAASDAINNVGLPYVFNEQVNIPGYGSGRALCAYQMGTLGNAANGQSPLSGSNPHLHLLLHQWHLYRRWHCHWYGSLE